MSLLRQAFALRSTFPESQVSVHGDTLTWIGQLRPSELSAPYTARITYTLRNYPQVRVLDPPIIDEHEFVPHVYNTGDLCVYDDHDWSPRLLLIDSIVAWTIEWLLFWELFLATGRWFGDGPDDGSPPREPLEQVPAATSEI
jgi:hypothetical protein